MVSGEKKGTDYDECVGLVIKERNPNRHHNPNGKGDEPDVAHDLSDVSVLFFHEGTLTFRFSKASRPI